MALRECCSSEAEAHLAKHRDVATCDACGRLLLAYADDETFRLTTAELESKGIGFDTGRLRTLRVVAKER